MQLKYLYSQVQKEGLEISKKNQKFFPEFNLDVFLNFFDKAGLPEIEKLSEMLLLNKPEIKRCLIDLIEYLEKQTADVINNLYFLLSPKENLNNIEGSIIFIYGTSKSSARAIYGAEIYKNRNIPIVVSDKKESENYKNILIKNNVPQENIFEEKRGRIFLENAFYSIKIAEKFGLSINNIIVVSASLVALRAILSTLIFLPEGSQVYSLPIEYDSTNIKDPTSPQNWYKNELGIRIFVSEVVKLYIMKKEGLLK